MNNSIFSRVGVSAIFFLFLSHSAALSQFNNTSGPLYVGLTPFEDVTISSESQ